MRRTTLFRLLPVVFAFFLHVCVSQPRTVIDGAELRLALEKLKVLGSALYIGAHPDDENTALLAALAKGRLVRTAYLSITRGEGGQNLIGPEQGSELGILRTQELLSARRIDGARQFFTDAVDFGYSKTSEETLRFWGKEQTLGDVVWIIRKFRPDVIITRFTPTLGGHGNHTASAILAEEAFAQSGDSTKFPEQMKYVGPWKARRLVWNAFSFQRSEPPPPNSVSIDLGGYNPLLGQSYSEIAGESRSMHKSQGFGSAETRGHMLNYFRPTAGDSATTDLFDGINTAWSRIPGGERVSMTIDEALGEFGPERPSQIIPVLFRAYHQMQLLPADPWIAEKENELARIILECGGLWLDAGVNEPSAARGSAVSITATTINRSEYPFMLDRIEIPEVGRDTILSASLADNVPFRTVISVQIPDAMNFSQPYWLREPQGLGRYQVDDQRLVGRPENPPVLSVRFVFKLLTDSLSIERPVEYRSIDPVMGEQYSPFVIVPPVALNLHEKVFVFPNGGEKRISITLRGLQPGVSGKAWLQLPPNWTCSPDNTPFSLTGTNDEQTVSFTLRPSPRASSGTFLACADAGTGLIACGIKTIHYPHISAQTYFPVSDGTLLRLDLQKRGGRIGYIMGSGDDVPLGLKQAGYSVTLLSDDDLINGAFAGYDAIIAGIRAYNTRPQLKLNQAKIFSFVKNGGTYLVQYVTPQRKESEGIGPYPFTVSRDRVSDENAPVTFILPHHPVLNSSNRITEADFDGWIQERGLSFADTWDSHYQTPIACNDPGEPSKAGGLLIAQYGKGYYIYTGYSFFRQLPGGVGGAYRLFVNLISINRQ